ncbi:hypothetical protein [Paraburkholderia sp. BL10I2N1]|uniref:hypothetical protein n=1 Tax=Paraburkholderia sp. BL10I2N1 TaxID=1938796 RepID=UPI00105E88DD|nr:hypothetical protein [Paraburkholderia sp. BL10I2N1]
MNHANNEAQMPPSIESIAPDAGPQGWHRRAEQAERSVRDLTERLKGRDQQIAALQKAIGRLLARHDVDEERLEREIESLRAMLADARYAGERVGAAPTASAQRVAVQLPYLTSTLSGLFEVMHMFSGHYDDGRPPKSTTVAHAIDERLGLKGQASGEASRSAQTLAAAIRPDAIREAAGRHRPKSAFPDSIS